MNVKNCTQYNLQKHKQSDATGTSLRHQWRWSPVIEYFKHNVLTSSVYSVCVFYVLQGKKGDSG